MKQVRTEKRIGARFGPNLSFHDNTIPLDKTKGILCQKISVHRIRPDPATSPTELPICTSRTPATKPGLFLAEPGKDGISSVSPDPAEWQVPDIPYQKMLRTGELTGVHFPM
jgi:hypothetical protein